LPKFPGNNVTTVDDHLYAIGRDMENAEVEHEDVAMKLLASSLTEDAQRWFRGIPDNHIASYEDFSKLFKNRWTTKKDNGMLVAQFNQIKKKENETVSEFDNRFDRLYSQIPTDLHPTAAVVRLLYMNAFDGKFCFILKDKNPTTLAQAKEYSAEIEENILDSKVDPFQYPRVKAEAKTKASSSSAPDPISLLTQKIDQMSTQFVQAQNQIMGRLTTVERNQSAPRPQFARQQRDATGWKPRPQQEAKAPDTLKPVGMVDTEQTPWCSPCQEPHREDECPRQDEDSSDSMNFMDMICNFQEEEVTQEQIDEARRQGEREGRLWV
jgi:hypothetical protein